MPWFVTCSYRARVPCSAQVPLFDNIGAEIFEQMVPLMDCLEVDQVGADIITEGKIPTRLPIGGSNQR